MQVITILFNFLNLVIFVYLTFLLLKKLKRTGRRVDRLGMGAHRGKGGAESMRRG